MAALESLSAEIEEAVYQNHNSETHNEYRYPSIALILTGQPLHPLKNIQFKR